MATVPCPHCGQWMDDNELRCSHCEEFLLPTMTKTELKRLGESEKTTIARYYLAGAAIGLVLGLAILGALLLTAPDLRFVQGGDWAVARTAFGWVDIGFPAGAAIAGGLFGAVMGIVAKKRKR